MVKSASDQNLGTQLLGDSRPMRAVRDLVAQVAPSDASVLVIGETVSETLDRLYYFERAAQTYILALQTGKPLRIMSDSIAESVASEIENYPQKSKHLEEIKKVLDAEKSNYRD